MILFRTLGFGLGVIALLAFAACAAGRHSAEPSTTPTATAAEAPAADSSGSEDPADAGAAFYSAQGCGSCHGKDGGGGFEGPGIRGQKADALLSFMDGSATHGGGTVEDVTAEDAADLEAYLSASP